MDHHSAERQHSYLGKGIYSVPEASRLTGIRSNQIRRWLTGYQRTTKSGTAVQPSIFRPDFGQLDGKLSLSFLDLIEIQFIHSFRRHGVSWRSIRTAATRAADLLQFGHPFAKRQFFTDGKSILARIADEAKEPDLLNLVNSNYEIDRLVSPFLYGNLEFGELDVANRWWPSGKQAGIVVDPARHLGKPIVERYNIPTAVLAASYHAAQSLEVVADWYEIDQESVKQAIDFEILQAA